MQRFLQEEKYLQPDAPVGLLACKTGRGFAQDVAKYRPERSSVIASKKATSTKYVRIKKGGDGKLFLDVVYESGNPVMYDGGGK